MNMSGIMSTKPWGFSKKFNLNKALNFSRLSSAHLQTIFTLDRMSFHFLRKESDQDKARS